MVEWFESCLTVKLYKKEMMNREYLEGLASAFFNLHFYANYANNTIVIIGPSDVIENACFLLRNKGKILTSCYGAIEYKAFQTNKSKEIEKP